MFARGVFIPTDTQTDFSSWHESVTQQISDGQDYEFVIGDALDPGGHESWDEDLFEKIRETRSRTWKMKGGWQNIFKHSQYLARTANTIYLIDPYFNPISDQDHEQLVSALLSRKNNSNFTKLSFVTGIESFKETYEWLYKKGKRPKIDDLSQQIKEDLTERYSHILGSNRRLHWHLIPKSHPKLELHDRFFLTEKGGLSLGKGFAKTRTNSLTTAYLDKDHHSELCQLFIENLDLSRSQRDVNQPKVGVFCH